MEETVSHQHSDLQLQGVTMRGCSTSKIRKIDAPKSTFKLENKPTFHTINVVLMEKK